MCKTCIPSEMKEKIIRLVTALMPNVKLILFGSRTLDRHPDRSDIDLALDAGERLKPVDVGEVREVLQTTLIPYSFDVVDYHFVSEDMQEMIRKQGVVWKS